MNLNSTLAAVKQYGFLICFLAALLVVNPATAQNQENSIESHLKTELAHSASFNSFLDVLDSLKDYYRAHQRISFAQKTDQQKSELFARLQSLSDETKYKQSLAQIFVDPDVFINFSERLKTIKERLERESPQLFQLSKPEMENIIRSIIVDRLKGSVSSARFSSAPVALGSYKVMETREECLEDCFNDAERGRALCFAAALAGLAICTSTAIARVIACAGTGPFFGICVAAAIAFHIACDAAVIIAQEVCFDAVNSTYETCVNNCPEEFFVYRDADGDGYGNLADRYPDAVSEVPAGYVRNNSDCDDNNSSAHPGGTEICGNAVDEDCVNGSLECGGSKVQLLSQCEGDNILLQWETNSKINWPQYVIEKSTDGLTWEAVGSVVELNRNVTSESYSFKQAILGVGNFYRVIGFRLDGNKLYSQVVSPPCISISNVSMSPNPVREIGVLTIISSKTIPVNLFVYNSVGEIVYKEALNVYVGNNKLQINLSNLPAGVYAVHLKAESMVKTLKILKGSK